MTEDPSAFFPPSSDGGGDDFWSGDAPAGFATVTPGRHKAELIKGERFTANTGTAGYRLLFKILDGADAGKLVGRDLWFTESAKGLTRGTLKKIGINDDAGTRKPLPMGYLAEIQVGGKRDNPERSEVKDFKIVGRRPDAGPDPFAPVTPTPAPTTPSTAAPSSPAPVTPQPLTPAPSTVAAPDPLAALLAGMTPDQRLRFVELATQAAAVESGKSEGGDRGDAWEGPADQAADAAGWRPDLPGPYGDAGGRR